MNIFPPLVVLVLLASAGAAPELEHGAGRLLLQSRESDAFAPVAELAAGERHVVPLPLRTLSERVPRAVRGPRGFGLRISAAAPGAAFGLDGIRVRAVRHARDVEVLLDRGEPVLVGPAVPVRDAAPELARQDGIEAPAPERGGADLLALRDDAPRTLLRAPFQGEVDRLFRAGVRDLGSAQVVELELRTSALLPPATWGEARRHGLGRAWRVPTWADAPSARGQVPGHANLSAFDGQGLAPEPGGALELWFSSPPDAPASETWTLLVELEGNAPASAPEADRPLPAAAPRPPLFEDGTRAAGASMLHLEGPEEQLDIRPTMGPGAAWGDADGDGWVDLYLVQGGEREGLAPRPNRLLANRGDGGFEALSNSGTGDTGAGMGALFFDAEGDADLDLYVANYGADVLYRNRGPARFDDASEAAGIGSDLWSAGLAAGDFDADGDLDLYVTSYLTYDEALMPPADGLNRYRREDPIEMLPFAFPGQRNTFLRNESTAEALRFLDVTEELGLLDVQGRGMQPAFWDFDRDGAPDLYVANDVSFNQLWRNTGGRFEDVSFSTGMDDPRGGMGLAIGDVDRDGDEDLFLTNWELDANALYRNNLASHSSQRHRVASFRDVIVPSGLGRWSVGATSWGAELQDFDLDGDLDLYVANGYTSPDYESTGICVGQPDHYFANDGEGRFAAAFREAGAALEVALPSRCAVACDYDRDGDPDLLVTANNSAVRLLVNRTEARHPDRHWLGLRLRSAGPNSFGIGAEVTVHAGGEILRKSLLAGTSYLGGNAPELSFGLGDLEDDVEIVVRWPSGETTRHEAIGIDRWITLSDTP